MMRSHLASLVKQVIGRARLTCSPVRLAYRENTDG